MATAQIHIRSISLPSRLPSTNPTSDFESYLQNLNTSKATPISSEAIQSSLLCLAELYNSVSKLTHSPSISESLLERSVELLDSCNTIRELFQLVKENVQALQSAFRRKGLEHSSIQNDIATYFCSRKKMNKCITKTLKKLKNSEQKNGSDCKLGEVMGVNAAIFKSILVMLSCEMAKSGGWSLVSKYFVSGSKSISVDVENDVGSVDFALNFLQGKMRNNEAAGVLDLQMVQKRLKNLDACIEGFEYGLEKLFRELIQNRVAILNILTHV